MIDFLKESLIFQHLLGVDASFDFITGRAFTVGSNKKVNQNINQNTDVIQDDLKSANKEKSKEFAKDNVEKSIQKKDFEKSIEKQNESIVYQKKGLNGDISAKINELKQELKNVNTFEELVDKIKQYDGCELKQVAKNSVVFDGNYKSNIMLIGEAPGETEEINGIPFCGQSGQLLRKVLNFANLSTTNGNLFITNTVFWRPPMNRKPEKDEIQICLPFVYKMIEIIKPKLVILCGSTAINTFLTNVNKVGDAVGKFTDINFELNVEKTCVKGYSIYHPSFLLRNPIMKKTSWKHMLRLKDFLLKNEI